MTDQMHCHLFFQAKPFPLAMFVLLSVMCLATVSCLAMRKPMYYRKKTWMFTACAVS